jgi:hypothetical protein
MIAHKSPAEASDSPVSHVCGAEVEMLKFTDRSGLVCKVEIAVSSLAAFLPRSEEGSERRDSRFR